MGCREHIYQATPPGCVKPGCEVMAVGGCCLPSAGTHCRLTEERGIEPSGYPSQCVGSAQNSDPFHHARYSPPTTSGPHFATSSWMRATKAWKGSVNHQLRTEPCGGPVWGPVKDGESVGGPAGNSSLGCCSSLRPCPYSPGSSSHRGTWQTGPQNSEPHRTGGGCLLLLFSA